MPLDLNTLKALKRCSDPTKANEHRTVQDFRRKVLRELKKIKIAWPELHYSTAKGVLILSPSTLPL